MKNNVKLKQTLIVGGFLLLVVFLFTRDIKGLPAEDEANRSANGQVDGPGATEQTISIDQASEASKGIIGKALSVELSALENKYRGSKDEEKITLAAQLAQKWDDVEQFTPSALYLEVVANAKPNLGNWLTTGNRFLKAFDGTQDTLAQPILLQKANTAYTKALALDTNNVEAKTGLGVTIVNGLGAPMQGISMLLDVVKKEPKNIKANMNLGLFAIKSGQFAKAIPRFNTVIENAPTPEAYFYLGTALENLGKNKEAIDVYLKSKKLAGNSTLSSFIDKRIADLKNKN